jgi:hypothetical protein
LKSKYSLLTVRDIVTVCVFNRNCQPDIYLKLKYSLLTVRDIVTMCFFNRNCQPDIYLKSRYRLLAVRDIVSECFFNRIAADIYLKPESNFAVNQGYHYRRNLEENCQLG